MKILFLVETTSNKQWEMNTGFHLVMAENIEEASKIAIIEKPGERILSVKDINHMMIDKPFLTIIDYQVE